MKSTTERRFYLTYMKEARVYASLGQIDYVLSMKKEAEKYGTPTLAEINKIKSLLDTANTNNESGRRDLYNEQHKPCTDAFNDLQQRMEDVAAVAVTLEHFKSNYRTTTPDLPFDGYVLSHWWDFTAKAGVIFNLVYNEYSDENDWADYQTIVCGYAMKVFDGLIGRDTPFDEIELEMIAHTVV